MRRRRSLPDHVLNLTANRGEEKFGDQSESRRPRRLRGSWRSKVILELSRMLRRKLSRMLLRKLSRILLSSRGSRQRPTKILDRRDERNQTRAWKRKKIRVLLGKQKHAQEKSGKSGKSGKNTRAGRKNWK